MVEGTRRTIAAAVAVLGSLPVLEFADNSWVVFLFPAGTLAACALVFRPELGAQVAARAAWWSNLIIGCFLCLVGGGSESRVFMPLLIGCGAALLLVGDAGLTEARKRGAHDASSFVTTLMLAMVFALADTLSLVVWGFLLATKSSTTWQGVVLLVGAVAMGVAFIGLYRAKTWGIVANVGTNLIVAAVALSGVLPRLKDELVVLLCCTAAIQLLVPVPMLWTLVKGKPPVTLRAWHKRWAMRAVVSGITLVGVAAATIRF
jgi:hypothetical protein